MTPPASAAARSLPQSTPGHRRGRPARGRPSSRPRRYSGPAGGVASATAVAAPGVALPRRAPAAPRRTPRERPRRSFASVVLPIPSVLSPQRLIAISLRGRVWIAIVAVGLIGLITAQLIVLRMNTSIGRSLARASALSRENAAMAIANSEAGSGEEIETLARGLGMIALSPGELHFRRVAGRNGAQAAAQLLRSSKALSATEGSGASSLAGAGSTSLLTSTAQTAASEPAASEPAASGQEATMTAETQPSSGPPAQETQPAGTGAVEQQTLSATGASQQTPSTGQESQAGATQAPGAGG